jgi:microcystin degradation protein MlrC
MLAQSFWDVRNEFEFIAPTTSLEESLDMAIESDAQPFIISDMGDNPTAGGAGDVTWTIRQILDRPEFQTEEGPSLIYASIPGPDFVEAAVEAGVGGTVSEYAGAQVDDRSPRPFFLKAKLRRLNMEMKMLRQKWL